MAHDPAVTGIYCLHKGQIQVEPAERQAFARHPHETINATGAQSPNVGIQGRATCRGQAFIGVIAQGKTAAGGQGVGKVQVTAESDRREVLKIVVVEPLANLVGLSNSQTQRIRWIGVQCAQHVIKRRGNRVRGQGEAGGALGDLKKHAVIGLEQA
ncbi:MAG: hypothetical protein COW02_16725 [Comamonadaceae bacterium CG12_big_fil_rev_8_21_14_0_65_59_15]|nr:MAG: hypothetical protein COW02_16725 [Comamonadaceae bacterium CG12_big_fil_rev_8_21_14_0_65_59_15]